MTERRLKKVEERIQRLEILVMNLSEKMDNLESLRKRVLDRLRSIFEKL